MLRGSSEGEPGGGRTCGNGACDDHNFDRPALDGAPIVVPAVIARNVASPIRDQRTKIDYSAQAHNRHDEGEHKPERDGGLTGTADVELPRRDCTERRSEEVRRHAEA